MTTFIRLDPADNVVTVTTHTEAGQAVESITASAIIPKGHKIATRNIEAGEPITKYAQLIGYASENISAGDHVHTHNVEFRNTNQN